MGSEFPGLIPRGAAFYAALYVVAVCLAARTMGGPAAGALAALVVGISPFARDMARMVMSDAFAAALTMLLIPLLHKPTRNRALWAGFLAGSLVAVRLPMVLNLAALFVALPRSLWSRAILAASIPLAAYAAFNHVTYGGPFTTGYHLWVPLKNFSLDYVTTELMKEGPCITPDALQGWIVKLIDRRPSSGWSPGGPQNDFPNYILYPAVLSGVFWVFTPPFLSLLGLWSYWRDRNRPEIAVRLGLMRNLPSVLLLLLSPGNAIHGRASERAAGRGGHADCPVVGGRFLNSDWERAGSLLRGTAIEPNPQRSYD